MTAGILSAKKPFGNFGKDIHSTFNIKQFYECIKIIIGIKEKKLLSTIKD